MIRRSQTSKNAFNGAGHFFATINIVKGIKPEAEEKETTTVIKIGGFSFTVKASEYYALIDDIRDNGIFEPAEIRAELQRRILND